MHPVTKSDLEAVVRRINRTLNGTDETPVYDRDTNGHYVRANPDVFYLDGAYGGFALYRTVGTNSGATDVLSVGHVPKRQLHALMHAFLRGVELAT
jgi:hypothetical protein